MLWLALAPKRLALDALTLASADGVAVTARHGSRRWVVATREALFPGVEAGAVMAARPELRLTDADPHAEIGAMQDLAAVAHDLGAPVHLERLSPDPEQPAGRAAVWVEAGRSLRVFGGIDGLLAAARERLAEQPLACGLAVAPTLESAALAARLDNGCVLQTRQALRDWLDGVPVQALPLSPRARDGLRASGIRRCGALLALPVDQVARRFGSETTVLLDRLTGRAPDPRRAHRLPLRFRRRLRFDGDIHRVEGLGFGLQRLLGALERDLRARDTGARGVTILLHHEDHPDTMLDVPLSAPARDAGYWLLMARERMSRLTLAGPVEAMTLACDDFAPLDAPQLDLFDTGRAQTDAWRQTVERLVARLGVDAVWRMGVAADHRPERAWRRLPTEGVEASDAPDAEVPGDRPVWLFDPPRPLAQPPELMDAPERIETGWWDGAGVARDYFAARSLDGTRMWVFQDRADRQWYLHGLWA